MTTNQKRKWRRKLHKMQGGLCCFCKRPMVLLEEFEGIDWNNADNVATLEHLQDYYHPLGRTNDHSKLACSCHKCNHSRNLERQAWRC